MSSIQRAMVAFEAIREEAAKHNVDVHLLGPVEAEFRAIEDVGLMHSTITNEHGIEGISNTHGRVQVKTTDSWYDTHPNIRSIDMSSLDVDTLVLYTPHAGDYIIPIKEFLEFKTKKDKKFIRPHNKKFRIKCTKEFQEIIKQYKIERKTNGSS